MNVIYPVRPGPNEELRYSLRSLANLGDGEHEVWIVGSKPRWLRGVHFIEGNTCGSDRRGNSTGNLLRACDHIPEHVVQMDDDMYVMQRGYEPRVQWFGTVTERLAETYRFNR